MIGWWATWNHLLCCGSNRDVVPAPTHTDPAYALWRGAGSQVCWTCRGVGPHCNQQGSNDGPLKGEEVADLLWTKEGIIYIYNYHERVVLWYKDINNLFTGFNRNDWFIPASWELHWKYEKSSNGKNILIYVCCIVY